jgi:hypothetical protein
LLWKLSKQRFIIEYLQKLYLVGSLRALIKRYPASPALLVSHVKLMQAVDPAEPAKILRNARRYTCVVPKSGQVWLERLAVEKRYGSHEESEQAWADARQLAEGEVEKIWMWGIEELEGSLEERQKRYHVSLRFLKSRSWLLKMRLQRLLKESLRDSRLDRVHEQLLISLVTSLYGGWSQKGQVGSRTRLETVSHMVRTYLPNGRVWAVMFGLERKMGDEGVLRAIYEEWRRRDGEAANSAMELENQMV